MRRSALAALLLVGAVMTACSKPAATSSDATSPVKPPRGSLQIRFATDWRAEAEQGGFYQALASGGYARRGLDVRIIQGGPGTNVSQLLAAGAVEMGIGSNSFTVLNLAAEHVPVEAVSASFQKDPQVLIAHPDAGVASLADLKGHPILLADAAVNSFWPWLKAKYGLKDDQVRKYTFNAGPFLSDRRAAQEGYVTSEPYTVEQTAHFKPKVFLLADAGYPGYAAMTLVPNAFAKAHPTAVRAFVAATVAGWQTYLYGDPSKGDAAILKANPEMREDVLSQARAKLRDYGIVQSGGAPIGSMTDARWKGFYDTAAGLGLVKAGTEMKAAYSLDYLP